MSPTVTLKTFSITTNNKKLKYKLKGVKVSKPDGNLATLTSLP
jgi:hypothetical protein